MSNNVVIIDSGLGGLSLLKPLYKKIPYLNYIYFADTKNLPYGLKTKNELLSITTENIKYVIKEYNPCLIIFGCNTIGTTIFKEISNKFNNIKMFALRPNIATAINKGYKKILLLGTSQTIKNIKKSKDYINNKNNIVLCDMPLLATKIEKYIQTPIKIEPYLKDKLNKFNNIDCIILGCSHYYFIKNQLKNLFKSADFIDNTKILSNEVKKYLIKNNLFNDEKFYENNSNNIKLILTKEEVNKNKYNQIIKKIVKRK